MPKINKETVILRDGYSIHFLSPGDAKMDDLINTGKIIGQATVDSQTLGDNHDEVVVIVKK